MTTAIEGAREFSTDTLNQLRKVLVDSGDDYTIVVGGSLARMEASPLSDIDYFFFGEDAVAISRAKAFLASKRDAIADLGLRAPADGGAFGESSCEQHDVLLSNIGGGNDTNEKMTRRILFLLEGAWLAGRERFNEYRRDVIERYTPLHTKKTRLCRFLLNDIIRYYRTICVDFEYKTAEEEKVWGSRYIKLRFSRKILYFGGLIAVAETADLDRSDKVSRLIQLLELPPIERITNVCPGMTAQVLDIYNCFLSQLSNRDVRAALGTVTQDPATHSETFVNLRKLGSEFTDALVALLQLKYRPDHPIHKAVMF